MPPYPPPPTPPLGPDPEFTTPDAPAFLVYNQTRETKLWKHLTFFPLILVSARIAILDENRKPLRALLLEEDVSWLSHVDVGDVLG